MPLKENASEVFKSILPQGNILNDNGTDVDHLGHVVYAEALVRQIERIETPMTIGIFAKWGSGKSFLMKQVANLVATNQMQKETEQENKSPNGHRIIHSTSLVFAVFMLCFVVLFTILSIRPDFVTVNASVGILRTASLICLICCLFLFLLAVQRLGSDLVKKGSFSYFDILPYAFFTKLPICEKKTAVVRVAPKQKIALRQREVPEKKLAFLGNAESKTENTESKKSSTRRRYIFVHFNAWEYAGCDTLWAGIVTNLADSVENEFGKLTARLFRTINLSVIDKETSVNTATSSKLFVRLPAKLEQESDVKNMMKEYGVVRHCKLFNPARHTEFKKKTNNDNNWWEVCYNRAREASAAIKTLSILGIQAQTDKPQANKPDVDSSMADKSQNQRSFWKHYLKHPRVTFKVSNLAWTVLFFIILLLVPAICSYVIATYQNGETELSSTAAIVTQILSWLPAGVGIFYGFIKVIWAMFNSQRSRVEKALEGVRGNLAGELGFMNKIKSEVHAMGDLIHSIEFTHNVEYKVVITIDDLDRIPLSKVRSVLEAVSILLSDRHSPFICLIAVDSRVAVRCFEEETEEKTKTNGYEYLKKIINLPFCLPEIDTGDKIQFLAGLMDEADDTKDIVAYKTVLEEGMSEQITISLPRHTRMPHRMRMPRRSMRMPRRTMLMPQVEAILKPRKVEHFDDLKIQSRTHLIRDVPEPMFSQDESIDEKQDSNIKSASKAQDEVISIPLPSSTSIQWPTSTRESPPMTPKTSLPRSSPLSTESSITEDESSVSSKSSIPKSTPSPSTSDASSSESELTVESQASTRALKTISNSYNQQEVAEAPINFHRFLFTCRDFMLENSMVVEHLQGNPRNIKRIFNVISVTASIIQCHQRRREKETFLRQISEREHSGISSDDEEDEQKQQILDTRNVYLAQDVVLWVILADQWPYRTSYLLQVIEDADQRTAAGRRSQQIVDSTPLADIYMTVCNELTSSDSSCSLLSLDGDPDILYSYLVNLKEKNRLNKSRVKELLKYTVNLDYSLKQDISYERGMNDMANLTKSKLHQQHEADSLSSLNLFQSNNDQQATAVRFEQCCFRCKQLLQDCRCIEVLQKKINLLQNCLPTCYRCKCIEQECSCRDKWMGQMNDLMAVITNHQDQIDYIGTEPPCGFCRKDKSEECVCNEEFWTMRDYIKSVQGNHFAETEQNCHICGNIRAECFCQAYSERFYSYVKETLTAIENEDQADYLDSFHINTSCWRC
ncbi:unnamed protein product [Clavelina lepadiformis]|uniref:KAP NTPase domain-containing protein n=1 Tax=Clavelina lepadiformis TaxID=159417 RepID=A0ABP0G1V9_CLALP